MARWGMPGPPQFGGQPVTNIRNVASPHWRGWLSRNRCLVPATSFCEYADTKPRETPTWFAISEDEPLFAFAGLWTRWRRVRGPKSAPVEGEHELFGFLTTEANAIVAPVHPKAMPVILTTTEEFDLWLEGETVEALKLQRPLPYGTLRVVTRREKDDSAPAQRVRDHLAANPRRDGTKPSGPSAKLTRTHNWDRRARHHRRRGLGTGPCSAAKPQTTWQRLLHTFDYWRSCKSEATPVPMQLSEILGGRI